MFALTLAPLALARIQQAKQIKLERKPSGKSAAKSIIPTIARRGLAVLAMIALAAGSAQARTGGGPSGGGFGGGAGIFHGSNGGGFNSNVNRPIQNSQPVQQNTPIFNSSNIQKTQTNLNAKPVDLQHTEHVKTFDKLNGNPNGASISRHTDSIKNIDSTKITGDHQPVNLDKKLDAKTISKPNGNTGIIARGNLNGGKKSLNGKFVDAVKSGKLDSLTNGAAARKIGMADQFKLMDKGNVAGKLKLSDKLAKNGGWQKRMCGPIDSHYCDHCKGQFYCGPKWCPGHCWCPKWCGWVSWCFGCPMWFDPRPDFCEPIACDDCVIEETVVINREGTPDSWVDDQPTAAPTASRSPTINPVPTASRVKPATWMSISNSSRSASSTMATPRRTLAPDIA